MEELAKKLRDKIDTVCGRYHYYKDRAVLEKSMGLVADIRQYCSYFLQGNIFGLEEAEYMDLQLYVMQVLKDYMEALEQKDLVYMLDTLDYGLRELLNLYIKKDTGERNHG